MLKKSLAMLMVLLFLCAGAGLAQTAVLNCSRCSGTGKCWSCGGGGLSENNPCFMCNGTGRCYFCSGKGTVE